MDLAELDRLLDRAPVVLRNSHLVSLAFLQESVRVYSSVHDLSVTLDSLQPTALQRAVILDAGQSYVLRFPIATVEHDPFTPALNHVLFDRYDFISELMLNHAQVAQRIIHEAQGVQTLVLVLLDGLSYADCRDWSGVQPCLAVAPTITRVGFPAIIGAPPLAARLSAVGLNRRVGFTYWTRNAEPLTKRLFHTIADTHQFDSSRPDTFGQVLDWLSNNDLSGTYVQVVRTALDEFAEGHRATVPRQAVLAQIRRDLDSLYDILEHKGLPVLLFAVADHGILWKEDQHEIEEVDLAGARYVEGLSGAGRGRCFEAEGKHYWVLDYPQMGRPWKTNEQGIHGGISFEELIVPFLQQGANLPC